MDLVATATSNRHFTRTTPRARREFVLRAARDASGSTRFHPTTVSQSQSLICDVASVLVIPQRSFCADVTVPTDHVTTTTRGSACRLHGRYDGCNSSK